MAAAKTPTIVDRWEEGGAGDGEREREEREDKIAEKVDDVPGRQEKKKKRIQG